MFCLYGWMDAKFRSDEPLRRGRIGRKSLGKVQESADPVGQCISKKDTGYNSGFLLA